MKRSKRAKKSTPTLKALSYKLIADIIMDFIKKRRRSRKARKKNNKEQKPTSSAIPLSQGPAKQVQDTKKDDEVKAAKETVTKAKAMLLAKQVKDAIEDSPKAVAAIEAGAPVIIEEEVLVPNTATISEIEESPEKKKKPRPYNTPYEDKRGNKVRKVLEENAATIMRERHDTFMNHIINTSNPDNLLKLYQANQSILPKTIKHKVIGPTVSRKEFITEMMHYTPVKTSVMSMLDSGNTKPTNKEIIGALKSGLDEATRGSSAFNTPKKTTGGGKDITQGPLNNQEIMTMMLESGAQKHGFLGVYAIDQFRLIKSDSPVFNLIANTIPIKNPGVVGHWVAINSTIGEDGKPAVEYYDPLGEPPKVDMLRAIRRLTKRLGVRDAAGRSPQFKVNKVQDQRFDTDTCGWHAMDFLRDRYAGKPFREASGFNALGEKNIKAMKKHWKAFGKL